jgi:hypothetical protein
MVLGSGIRKKPNPDPGSRGQKGTGSRIRIRNTVPNHGNTSFRIRSVLMLTLLEPDPHWQYGSESVSRKHFNTDTDTYYDRKKEFLPIWNRFLLSFFQCCGSGMLIPDPGS